MSKKLLGDFAALLGGLQSPVRWYNEKKEKEREKERKKERKKEKRNTFFRQEYLLWGIRLDQSGYRSGPWWRTPTGKLQLSLTHFPLIVVGDLVGGRPRSRRSQGWVLWSLLGEDLLTVIGCSQLQSGIGYQFAWSHRQKWQVGGPSV